MDTEFGRMLRIKLRQVPLDKRRAWTDSELLSWWFRIYGDASRINALNPPRIA